MLNGEEEMKRVSGGGERGWWYEGVKEGDRKGEGRGERKWNRVCVWI